MKVKEINRRNIFVRVVPEQLQVSLLLLLLQYDKQGWCNILSAKITKKIIIIKKTTEGLKRSRVERSFF